jgi:mycothiol synthase
MELRPPRREDAPAIVEASRRFGLEDETPAEIEAWFDVPSNDLERDARVAVVDGSVVGYADVGDGWTGGKILWLDVRAEGEVARLLFDWVEQRARELAIDGARVKAWSPEGNADWRAMIEARGFEFDHYSFRMLVDLPEEPPTPAWPDGITVRTYRREQDEQVVYETHQETFSEERDFAPEPFDDWVQWWHREPFDPELWFLAEERNELIGILLGRPERRAHADAGWISIIGVRKAWRGRGFGRALLQHAFAEFRKRGKLRVGLGVDGQNTDAIRLYERAGMRPEKTFVWYEKAV